MSLVLARRACVPTQFILRLTDDDVCDSTKWPRRIAPAVLTVAGARARPGGGTGYDHMSAKVRCPDGYYLDGGAKHATPLRAKALVRGQESHGAQNSQRNPNRTGSKKSSAFASSTPYRGAHATPLTAKSRSGVSRSAHRRGLRIPGCSTRTGIESGMRGRYTRSREGDQERSEDPHPTRGRAGGCVPFR
jgi:hypothetical protein